jgi:pyroglutamyl-peptidase
VKPLHGEILQTDPALRSGNYRAQAKSIHITSNLVPVTYKDVLERVPGFHARPPVLPDDQDLPTIDPPADGYDLVFHVGVSCNR